MAQNIRIFGGISTLFSKMKNWYKLSCNECELQLSGTLNGGQSFRCVFHKNIA